MDGQRLTFEVYGVWRKNMLMRDRETGTLWQHATGEALDGALKGRRLEILPGWETTWGELHNVNPQATFVLEPVKFTGLFPKKVLMKMLHITHITGLEGLSPQDKRLDAHELVIGVVINGEAKAYPIQILRLAASVRDRLGGEEIEIVYISSGDRISIHKPGGAAIPYERQWWLGWSEFHPRSAIYSAGENETGQ